MGTRVSAIGRPPAVVPVGFSTFVDVQVKLSELGRDDLIREARDGQGRPLLIADLGVIALAYPGKLVRT